MSGGLTARLSRGIQTRPREPLAQVAQSVEQGTENPRVGGSIPPLGTNNVAKPRTSRGGENRFSVDDGASGVLPESTECAVATDRGSQSQSMMMSATGTGNPDSTATTR